jgi:hypothetical protein
MASVGNGKMSINVHQNKQSHIWLSGAGAGYFKSRHVTSVVDKNGVAKAFGHDAGKSIGDDSKMRVRITGNGWDTRHGLRDCGDTGNLQVTLDNGDTVDNITATFVEDDGACG